MPTNNVRDDYAAWLASPPTTGLLVETIEIFGTTLGSPILLANRKDSPLQALDEMGMPRVFLPVAFSFSKPAIRNSSEYSSIVRIDGIQGRLLKMITKIRSSDLAKPLFAVLRIYVDPIMLDRPAWLAPLRFRVEEAKVTMDVVELSLVGGRMPTKRAGNHYTLERFVGLRPF